MKWLPPWLAKAYARIYAEKKTDVFGFSEAARILGLKDERPLAKTLAKLKMSGHLMVRRDPVDSRRKLFNLTDPASVTLAFAIQSRAKNTELIEKLRAAAGSLDYYLSGSYTAHQYHHYSVPGRIDISVRPDQLLVWVALASERDTAISIGEVPAEKSFPVNVHLRTDFDPKLVTDTKLIDGVRYLSAELLIALGLAEGDPHVEDVLAILVVQKENLNWNKLLALCEAYGATRYLGYLLEVLNFESGKALFSPAVIRKAFAEANLKARFDFPAGRRGEPPEAAYLQISSRWNLTSHVSRSVVAKIVTDLVRA